MVEKPEYRIEAFPQRPIVLSDNPTNAIEDLNRVSVLIAL
jgi:hypothetical protein